MPNDIETNVNLRGSFQGVASLPPATPLPIFQGPDGNPLSLDSNLKGSGLFGPGGRR